MRITNKVRGRAAIGVAALAAAGASITVAQAHVPGVGNGLPPSTNAPDLRSAKITRLDLVEAGTERAEFCFDANVSNVGLPSAYGIQGYDSAKSFTATGVSKSTTSDACVVAEFADGSDLSQGTTAVVRANAASTSASVANNLGSEPLGGSAVTAVAGSTTGPDLVSAEPDVASGGNYFVTYTFDESLNPAPATAYDPADFIVYDNSGTANPGTSVVNPNPQGRSIRIGYGAFNTANGNQVYTSTFGAVEDRPMTTGGVTGSAQGIIGTNTARARILAAAPSSASTYKVTFSENVNTPLAPRFFAITDVGTGFPATSVSAGDDPRTVNVTFPAEVARDPGNVVRIYAAPGAVQSASSTPSIISQATTSTPNSVPGFTNGPDLLGVALGADRLVTFRFDEPVNADSGSLPAATSFRGVAVDGSVQTGSSGVAADGNNYNVVFPTTLSTAVAFEVGAGVLTDRTARPNPIGSVSKENEQAPPAPPVVTPPVVTPPVVTPPAATKRPVFRTTFSSFKVKTKSRYSGRIASSGRGCKSGRRIALKRNGKTIRNGFTKGDGTFSITRGKAQRGKKGVYVVVTERTTSVITCTAKGSKKLKKG